MYLRPSWYCLFAGMGRFPAELCSAPQAVTAARARLNQLAAGPQLPSPSLGRRVGSRRTCPRDSHQTWHYSNVQVRVRNRVKEQE